MPHTKKRSAISRKISHLVKSEGVSQKQAVATALNMKRKGRLTKEGGYKKKKKRRQTFGELAPSSYAPR